MKTHQVWYKHTAERVCRLLYVPVAAVAAIFIYIKIE